MSGESSTAENVTISIRLNWHARSIAVIEKAQLIISVDRSHDVEDSGGSNCDGQMLCIDLRTCLRPSALSKEMHENLLNNSAA